MCVTKHHNMQTHGRGKAYIYILVILALGGNVWSASGEELTVPIG
jgi:hypothetical protein